MSDDKPRDDDSRDDDTREEPRDGEDLDDLDPTDDADEIDEPDDDAEDVADEDVEDEDEDEDVEDEDGDGDEESEDDSDLPDDEDSSEPIALVERSPLPVTAQMFVLAILVGMATLMFVLIEPTPRWVLVVAALVAALGTEGALRSAWPKLFAHAGDAGPYLFLPALYVIATPALIEHNVSGFWVIPAALGATAGFAALLVALVGSARPLAASYQRSRVVSTAITYFVAFALFSLVYVLDLDLLGAMVAVALVAAMLGIEVLREGEVDPLETLVFAGVVGLLVGQARLLLWWFDVDTYLAGLTLLIAFFAITGLLHAHLTRALTRYAAVEHAFVVVVGIALVVVARSSGLA